MDQHHSKDFFKFTSCAFLCFKPGPVLFLKSNETGFINVSISKVPKSTFFGKYFEKYVFVFLAVCVGGISNKHTLRKKATK